MAWNSGCNRCDSWSSAVFLSRDHRYRLLPRKYRSLLSRSYIAQRPGTWFVGDSDQNDYYCCPHAASNTHYTPVSPPFVGYTIKRTTIQSRDRAAGTRHVLLSSRKSAHCTGPTSTSPLPSFPCPPCARNPPCKSNVHYETHVYYIVYI